MIKISIWRLTLQTTNSYKPQQRNRHLIISALATLHRALTNTTEVLSYLTFFLSCFAPMTLNALTLYSCSELTLLHTVGFFLPELTYHCHSQIVNAKQDTSLAFMVLSACSFYWRPVPMFLTPFSRTAVSLKLNWKGIIKYSDVSREFQNPAQYAPKDYLSDADRVVLLHLE